MCLGFLVIVILSLATDQVLHVLKVYPPWGQPMQEPGLNLLALSYRIALAKPPGPLHCAWMQSHELLREVFQSATPKQVSSDLGLSISMIYKWAEPPEDSSGSGASNPLDRIAALIRSTKDERITQWICQRAGGFYIRNPSTHNPHPDFLIPATNEIIQEFADLLAVVASAAADNQISSEEARKIRARWEELKTVTECFVRCCEEGNFRTLKDRPPSLKSERK